MVAPGPHPRRRPPLAARNRRRDRRQVRRLRVRDAGQRAASSRPEEVAADHHAQRLEEDLVVSQGSGECRAVTDPQDQSGEDGVEGRAGGGLRVGVVDGVSAKQQQVRHLIAKLLAVAGATAIDLGVHPRDEHDRAQESGVAEEDGRDLVDHADRQLVGGRLRQRSSSISTAWSARRRAMPCS